MKKIFFIYTLRGSDLNFNTLVKINNRLQHFDMFDVYIDILNNPVPKPPLIPFDKSSINSPHQENLTRVLLSTDLACILQSKQVNSSEWVMHELKLIENNHINSIFINKDEWLDFISIDNPEILKESIFIKKIMNALLN